MIRISADWRLNDIGTQWTLERRRASGWRPMRYHCDRGALLRVSIPELIGDVPEAVMLQLMALPRWHGTKRKKVAPKSLHQASSRGARASARPLGRIAPGAA